MVTRQCPVAHVALAGGRHGLGSPSLAARRSGARIKGVPDWTLSCASFTEWKATRFPVGTLAVLLPWRLALGEQDLEA